jgi:hypothetical protein
MKTIITATAPTCYQLQSLHAFRLNDKKHAYDSGATGTKIFDTLMEARAHLRRCAELYAESDGCEQELGRMYDDIDIGYLTIDAVTASINEEPQEEITE